MVSKRPEQWFPMPGIPVSATAESRFPLHRTEGVIRAGIFNVDVHLLVMMYFLCVKVMKSFSVHYLEIVRNGLSFIIAPVSVLKNGLMLFQNIRR